MIAILDGETRPVLRHRRGVMWCPFCDRSTQDEGVDRWCDGCHAQYEDEVSTAETLETPETPRRGRRAAATSEADESEDVDDETADVL